MAPNRRQLLATTLAVTVAPVLCLPRFLRPVTLRWKATPRAISYRVFCNGRLYGETATPEFAIPNRPARWAVQAVNEHGAGPLSQVYRWL
jgi:hypothetical protein